MIYRKLRNVFSLLFSLVLVAALLSGNLPRAAALGSHLDTTFSGDGKTTIDFGGDDFGGAIAIQTNGKIVVAGTSETDFAVTRLDADGSLDTTFDGDGRVVTPVLGDGAVNALAIQPDGKIVVAGRAVVNGNQQFVVVRYNTNGSLDTTFDGNGLVYTLIEPFAITNRSNALDVTIQPDGKIIAVGQVSGTNTAGGTTFQDWAMVRYNTNGSLDTTFSGDGKVTTDFGGNSEQASSVLVLPTGKLLAGGAGGPASPDFALARYNPDGSLDTTFNGTGRVTTDFFPIGDGINDLKLQSDGKIVAGGYTVPDAGVTYLALARYNADGTLDTSFDGDGKLAGVSVETRALAIQSDGKIICIGGVGDFSLVRFNSNGSLDTGFGRAGRLTTSIFNNSFDVGSAVAIQANGTLVAAGSTDNNGNGLITDFAVVRYLPDMGKPFDFDNDGKTDIGIFRPASGEWWINRSLTGATFAAQFGQSSDKIAPADFTGDGKTDIAFFRPSTGFWFVLRSEDNSFYSFPYGTNGDIPAPADFDGDSKVDAAVFRPSTATWYISRSTGGSTFLQFGANGDVPVTADYDVDGRADIAIFRPSSGQWWIQRSTAGTIAFQFGNSSDKPVQGDYTGDGKADVAIWRPSTGAWFVLRSENSSFYSFPFGANGDIPAPGDFDGDGRFDATVFRPSNATWYSQRTTAGTLIHQFGASTDRPVPSAFIP